MRWRGVNRACREAVEREGAGTAHGAEHDLLELGHATLQRLPRGALPGQLLSAVGRTLVRWGCGGCRSLVRKNFELDLDLDHLQPPAVVQSFSHTPVYF